MAKKNSNLRLGDWWDYTPNKLNQQSEAALRAEYADVSPVRHGQWEYGDYYDIGDVCSECLWDSQMTQPSYRYCPNCGAKMDVDY